MNLNVKHDLNTIIIRVLKEQLIQCGIQYAKITPGEIVLSDEVSDFELKRLNAALNKYGIEIINEQKQALVEKIKDIIEEIVFSDDQYPKIKLSSLLTDRINYSYGYLSALFSEVTYMSIENYVIFQRIERAKQLLTEHNLSLTEASYKLNYSSVAHLSTQFKKTTGITPSKFQSIVRRKKRVISP